MGQTHPSGDDPLRGFIDASPEELQRAHDVLHAILTREVQIELSPLSVMCIHAAHDAISWVLGFPCGATFRAILNTAMQEIRANGGTAWRSHPPA